MRIAIAMIVAAFGLSQAAQAGCRSDGSYPGIIGPKKTVKRTLYLTPSGAGIYIITDRGNDKLSMRVTRPSGAAACNKRGPDQIVDCFPTVLSKGNHTVHITNPLNHKVPYKLECWSPG